MKSNDNFVSVTGMKSNKNNYIINGARFVVSSKFMPLSSKTALKDKFKNILKNEFAHLLNEDDFDIINSENVCSAVGKEDNIAVEK